MNLRLLTSLILAAVVGGTMVGCSSNDDNSSGGTTTAPQQPGTDPVTEDPGDSHEVVVVEIGQLNNASQESYVIADELMFGTKSNADSTYDEDMVYRVTNSSDVAVQFSMTQQGQGANEFQIIRNECGTTLAAQASCDVRIAFNGGNRRNGTIHGAIIFMAAGTPASGGVGGVGGTPATAPASQNQVSLPLRGELAIMGNEFRDDSDDDGHTVMTLAISNRYMRGADAIQTVTITNSGDDPAPNLRLDITGNYSIFANSCPAVLEEGESCTVEVLYNDYTSLDVHDPSMGSLKASSDRSDNYSLSFTGGETVHESAQ